MGISKFLRNIFGIIKFYLILLALNQKGTDYRALLNDLLFIFLFRKEYSNIFPPLI